MPFKSKAQARFMFAKKPSMAKKWAGMTEDMGSLPDHISTLKRKGKLSSKQMAEIKRKDKLTKKL